MPCKSWAANGGKMGKTFREVICPEGVKCQVRVGLQGAVKWCKSFRG